jgi:hypothetical protein
MIASAPRIEKPTSPTRSRAATRAATNHDVFVAARTHPAAQHLLGGAGRLTPGEQAARGAIQLHSAGSQRAQALSAIAAQQNDVHQWVSSTFERVRPGRRLPSGISATSAEDGKSVELVQRAKNGDVLSQVTATRDGGQLSFSSVTYGASGKASRAQWWSGPDGVSSAAASWNETRSKAPAAPPTLDALRNSSDPNVQVSESAVWRSGASLSSRTYQQGPSGVQSSTTTYGSQNNTDGIHGQLTGQFRRGSVDTARTETVLLPAAKGKATIVDSTAYAQGGVQATSTQVTQAPWEPQHAPNAADLGLLRVSRSDDEGHIFKSGAKQWTLEKSNGTDSYSAQTFTEGSSASSVIRTRVVGATVSSTTTGDTLNALGKAVPIQAQSSETFEPDGSIGSLRQSSTDPKGTTTVESYRRAQQMTSRGLDVTETLDAERVDANCQISGVTRQTQTRFGPDGPELLSTAETLSSPGVGRVSVLNGQPIGAAGLTAAQKQLALQGQVDAAKEAKTFFNKGLKNAAILATEKSGALANAAGVAGGVSGLVDGVDSLEQALRQKNLPRIASSIIGSGIAAKNIASGAYGTYRALAGLPSGGASGVSTALRVAGALDNVPGVSEDMATTLGIGAGRALGFAGPVSGAVSGAERLYQGIDSGNGYTIAQGAVGLAGAGAGAVIASAASSGGAGIIAEAVGVSALGGPEALLAGAAVGLATYGVQQLIGLFAPDTSHDIAPVKI